MSGNGRGESRESLPEKRKSPGTWPDDEKMREIVFKKAGIVSSVAEAAGLDRRTIQRRMVSDEQFRKWFDEARDMRLDLSESVVFHHIAARNLTAAIFHLKCQGKGRGWIERQEITGADGKGLLGDLADVRKVAESVRDALMDPEIRQKVAELRANIDARTIALMKQGGNGEAAEFGPALEEDAVPKH